MTEEQYLQRERACIAEFDGGLELDQAEQLALDEAFLRTLGEMDQRAEAALRGESWPK